MRLPIMSPGASSIKVPTTDLDEDIMSFGGKFGSGASYHIRRRRQSGSGPLVLLKSRLNPKFSSSDPSLNNKNREDALRVSSTEMETSTPVYSHSTRSSANGTFPSVSGPVYPTHGRPLSNPIRLSYLPRTETTLIDTETSGSSERVHRKSATNVTNESEPHGGAQGGRRRSSGGNGPPTLLYSTNESVKFQEEDDQPGNQNSPLSSEKPIRLRAAGEIQRGNLVLDRSANHHEHAMKREAHWNNQDPPFFGMRYPSLGGQHAEPLLAPQQQFDPQFPGYFGGGGYTPDPYNSTTTEPGGVVAHPYNVVGLLLAAASVIFIIIGIAFVFTRVRRRKPSPDEPDVDPNDLEMVETIKPDPYVQWLNMPEEEPPKPALKKQVKTVVRTVSRKMSLTPKPPEQVFTPGVPAHLRYQLKQIYVY